MDFECKFCGSKDVTRHQRIIKDGELVAYRVKCKACSRTSRVHLSDEVKEHEQEGNNSIIENTITMTLIKKDRSNVDWRSMLELAEKHQEIKEKTSASQHIAEINVSTSEDYFVILFSSDWHLGSLGVNYAKFREHIELLLKTENMYLITVGDLIDNFRSFRTLHPVLSQALSPNEQGVLLASILDELVKENKWLVAVWGNHDIEFDERTYGASPIAQMLADKVIYFNGRGIVKLTVNDITYTIALNHRFPGRSIYNPTHALIRAYREYFPADVIVQGDKHNHAYQWFSRFDVARELGMDFGGPTHYLQIGTFKVKDSYSERYFGSPQIGAPCIAFNTKEKESIWFPSQEHAMRFINK